MNNSRNLIFALLLVISTASTADVSPPPAPWDSVTVNSQSQPVQQGHVQQGQRQPARGIQHYAMPSNAYGMPPAYNPYRGQSAYPRGYGGRPPYPPAGYRYQNRPPYPGPGYARPRNSNPWDRMTRNMPWNTMGGWNSNNNGNNQGWGPDFGEGRIFTSSPDQWFSKDGIADLWDDMLEAPSRFGEMPGGWSAPSISVPNPVDVGEQFGEASKQIPDFIQDIPNMFDFNY